MEEMTYITSLLPSCQALRNSRAKHSMAGKPKKKPSAAAKPRGSSLITLVRLSQVRYATLRTIREYDLEISSAWSLSIGVFTHCMVGTVSSFARLCKQQPSALGAEL